MFNPSFGPIGEGTGAGVQIANNLTSKTAAREIIGNLNLSESQLASALRTISRATTNSTISISQKSGDLIIQITRAGQNGYQVMESIITQGGSKTVVQVAYDAAGNMVHYHPK